ncbi:MAG: phosphodiesterase [Candidatus Aerophobetes bacterium ADurb.Bin490]|nr:MAG: phosphodiesterase [Candidatus Aerophobetes bacterium ADurb.Bin490]HPI03810.1 YfcE family phosphodiesterase [Candidatus Goldiibacteriota bacterium]HPN64560.1 YfcE family phosphodiesterase [Candidatus Goldiibacteriota bacterium]HRQ44675.1 YfcE family phosphodiesterase [Candidatus Goldiibacteriota bacterium]
MERINNVSKIGVLSDTHSKHLSEQVIKVFSGVDLIIHAGDHTSREIITTLEKTAPLVSVQGNMDPDALNLEQQTVLILNDKFKIAVCHGAGLHANTAERMYKKFAPEKPDMIIFGHTHLAMNKLHNGILLFNPGSPTRGMGCNSVGVISLENGLLHSEIIKL